MQGFIQDFVLGKVRGKCVGGGHRRRGLKDVLIYVTVPVKRVLVAHLFKIELILP